MKKIITVSFFSNMENDFSFMFDRNVSIISFDSVLSINKFNLIRNNILKDYKNNILSQKLKSYNNYRVSFAISIVDIEKQKVRYKQFMINPINLKERKVA